MRFIEFLLESGPNDQEEVYPDRTPEEDAEHEKLMARYHKYREKKLSTKIREYVGSNDLIPTTSRMKHAPKGTELITALGRNHILKAPDLAVRAKIKKLIAAHDEAKQNLASASSSARVVSMAVKQTKTRSPEMDAVILEAAKKCAVSDAAGMSRIYVRDYIEHAVKSPWPEMEKYIFAFLDWVSTYWKAAYHNQQWPAYEKFLLGQMKTAYTLASFDVVRYAEAVKSTGWPELETLLIDSVVAAGPGSTSSVVQIHAVTLLRYYTNLKKAMPSAVSSLLVGYCHATDLLQYAVRMKKPWPAAEAKAVRKYKSASYKYNSPVMYRYANLFKNGKWPELGIV